MEVASATAARLPLFSGLLLCGEPGLVDVAFSTLDCWKAVFQRIGRQPVRGSQILTHLAESDLISSCFALFEASVSGPQFEESRDLEHLILEVLCAMMLCSGSSAPGGMLPFPVEVRDPSLYDRVPFEVSRKLREGVMQGLGPEILEVLFQRLKYDLQL